jgi:hypothetical protein
MMNASGRFLLAALACLLCQEAAAQMYKCKDANGRITYSGKECRQAGLSPAGEIKGQGAVVQAPVPSSAMAAEKAAVTAAARAAQTAKEPDGGCYTVVNSRGQEISRCRDGD